MMAYKISESIEDHDETKKQKGEFNSDLSVRRRMNKNIIRRRVHELIRMSEWHSDLIM